jgi:hypothetical protein
MGQSLAISPKITSGPSSLRWGNVGEVFAAVCGRPFRSTPAGPCARPKKSTRGKVMPPGSDLATESGFSRRRTTCPPNPWGAATRSAHPNRSACRGDRVYEPYALRSSRHPQVRSLGGLVLERGCNPECPSVELGAERRARSYANREIAFRQTLGCPCLAVEENGGASAGAEVNQCTAETRLWW